MPLHTEMEFFVDFNGNCPHRGLCHETKIEERVGSGGKLVTSSHYVYVTMQHTIYEHEAIPSVLETPGVPGDYKMLLLFMRFLFPVYYTTGTTSTRLTS